MICDRGGISGSSYHVQLKNAFLIYLDSQGILNEIKVSGLSYFKIVEGFLADGVFSPPFRFILKIDLLRIQEISNSLFMLFIMQPTTCYDIAVELTKYTINELTPVKRVSNSDIQILMHVTSYPNISFLSDSYHNFSKGLQTVSGILFGLTVQNKYMRSKVYYCQHPSCSNVTGKRHRPSDSTLCSFCGSTMVEDVRSQDIGEELTCQIICMNIPKTGPHFHSVKVKIRDELCSCETLQMGMEYTAVILYEYSDFVAWNINRKLPRFEILSKMGESFELPIPGPVSRLYYRVSENCPGSPWAFVAAISSIMGSDILPASSFIQLKIGLMLSLCTQNSSDAPVPLLIVGPELSAVQKLINRAGQLAERFVNFSAGHEHLGGKKKNYSNEETWYEAGAMILASSGVCNLGDWSSLKKDQCGSVFQSIESKKIVLNTMSKTKTEADFVPLKCSIWTYWCHTTLNNPDLAQLKTLINVFGMPYLAIEDDELQVRKLSDKILEISMVGSEVKEYFTIPLADFKEFISLANSRNLALSESASKLIHDFFVVMRKERPEYVPAGAIKRITSLAEAHARLALRNEISYDDVTAVLYFYTLSAAEIFGTSLINLNHLDHKSESLYEYMHVTIENFQVSLEKYLVNYLFL